MNNILTENEFTETIDKNIIEKLLSHPELLGSWTDSNGIKHEDKHQLIKLLNSMKHNKLKVSYCHSKSGKKDKFGRVYAKNSISLGSCGREIRGTLTKGTYIDIDIENCHPVLIHYFLNKFSFPCKTYSKYINDRDSYINIIKKNYNCSREEAKKFFIIAGYGGSYNKWYNTLGEDSVITGVSQEPLWNSFQNEAKLLADKFIDKNQKKYNEWLDASKKDYNQNFGFLSIMLQNYECEILNAMYIFFMDEGLIVNNNCVLCHDGIMLNVRYIKKGVLKRLEKHILDSYGYDLNIIDKPLEHLLDKMKDEELVAEGSPMDMDYLIGLKTYKQKKEYFERYVAKIIKTGEFIELDITVGNGGFKTYTHTTKKESTLIHSYKHLLAHTLFNEDEVDFKKQAPKPFINKWLFDSDMRTYMDQDWVPYNGVYKQSNKRIFNLFTGYSTVIASPLPDNHEKIIKPFMDVLLELCEGTPANLDFLLHFLAHIIQKPAEKLRQSIIFQSKQGAGKDTMILAMGKILGTHMVNSESNTENLCGKHATGLVKKLLVAFNESEARKSFEFEGIIKSLITEEKLTVNPKNLQPYDIDNRARLFVFSNKSNPIKFDGASIDRRFSAFKSTSKFTTGRSGFWKKLYVVMNHPKFARSLYQKLNNIDLKDYDFSKERLNVLTDTYRDMMRKQLPPVVEFMIDYVEKYQILYDEEIKGTTKELWSSYKKYLERNRPDSVKEKGFVGSRPNFISSFKELDIPLRFVKVKGERGFKFIPSMVVAHMGARGWMGEGVNVIQVEWKDMYEFPDLL